MPRIWFVLACAVLLSLAGVAVEAAEEGVAKLPSRGESLELPGLTAGCHVCEWRPKLNQMPAADQCGEDEAGKGKVGLFECGFSQDCQRECHFLRCGTI
jgi:hypothetical protein